MVTTIGIDIGGTKVLAVRITDGTVVDEARALKPADGLLSTSVFDAIRRVWADDVDAIGAGVAGLVSDGVFVWGPHVAGTGIRIADRLVSEFGVPAVADNDANAAVFGELHAGAGRGHRDLLLITVGTGIGGAIVANGSVYRGAHGFAGEWGHVVIDPDGLACACGNRGCWETLVSGPALLRRAIEAGIAVEAPEDVARAVADGHPIAAAEVERMGHDLGRGIVGLVSAFDPELVLIGGGLAALGDLLLGPARRSLAADIHGRPHRTPPPITAAHLGHAANAIGAALMAVEAR